MLFSKVLTDEPDITGNVNRCFKNIVIDALQYQFVIAGVNCPGMIDEAGTKGFYFNAVVKTISIEDVLQLFH
jgi:hypothetical protein